MKKILLSVSLLALACQVSYAQSTFDTAVEVQEGSNTYTVPDGSNSVYWKYTPASNCALVVSPLAGSYSSPDAFIVKTDASTQQSDTIQLKGAAKYPKTTYPAMKDKTVYFRMMGSGSVGFSLQKEDYPGVGTGLSADDPLTIELGSTQIIGNSEYTGYYDYPMYATFSATESGVLHLALDSYISSVSINGTSVSGEYNSGQYVYQQSVEAGQTYSITFNNYSPFTFTSSITHPTAGSFEMPFEMKEGANTVPADFGTYYYTYTPAKTGFIHISGDGELPGGQVLVYASKSNVTYASPAAQSETGAFEVRTEVPYTGTTYYICVKKIESTDADQTFTFAMEDYAVGEKEDNPIVISTLPDEETLPNTTGTFYYAVDVPAGTSKFLVVKATSTVQNSGTLVTIYPQGNSYGQPSGSSSIRYDVSGTADQRYIIRWISSESEPVKFSVDYEDIAAGDVISNPIVAQEGENVLTGDGTKYYLYSPKTTGKLSVSTTPGTTVRFPMSTSQYSDEYETTVSGSTYSIAVTWDQSYLIVISNAVKDDVFTVTEGVFAKGESRQNPQMVEDTYTIDPKACSNVWLAYKAEKAGMLTAACDVDYTSSNSVEIGKTTDSYLSSMMTSKNVGGDYITVYEGTVRVAQGDTVLVHLQLTNATEDSKVTFTLRDFEQGESFDKPFELTLGDSVLIPAATYSSPVWCKLTAEGGDVVISTSSSISGSWYNGLDAATADAGGDYVYADYSYDSETGTVSYALTKKSVEAGDKYIKFTSSWDPITLVLTQNGEKTTGIRDIASGDAAISTADGALSISGDASVTVYTLSGQRVASEKVTGHTSLSLGSGTYVVKVNGKTRKIIVK